MTLYNNKYRIESARLQGYDYGSNGAYHITICTKGRLPYFGKIVETDYNPSLPKATNSCLSQVNNLKEDIKKAALKTDYNPSLQLTTIGTVAIESWRDIPNHFSFVLLDSFILMPNHLHGILIINKQENNDSSISKSHNIASIIRAFKGAVKRYANTNDISFEWQERYHDRIIRDNKELDNTRLYIYNNPTNWLNDEYKNPTD